MKTPTFMIIPSMACQASCKYCFGPHEGEVMDMVTAEHTIEFIKKIINETETDEINVIFHGGEPLLAPFEIWERLLKEISKIAQQKNLDLTLSLQSNLWNLTDELMELFDRYDVSIGTSLDGPESICDISRGEGYFSRTEDGVKLAKKYGHNVSAIATITEETKKRLPEIMDFFMKENMPLVLHGAVKPMGDSNQSGFFLLPNDYGQSLIEAFKWYIPNRKNIQIETLDRYVKGIVNSEAGVCTFRDCLGMFLAISPKGDITFCQRMCGKPEYVIGNVFKSSGIDELFSSPAAEKLKERQLRIKETCGECDFYEICKGGCYYNAEVSGEIVDPQCEAYKAVYEFVRNELISEMGSEENIEAILEESMNEDTNVLFRKGGYTSLAYTPHPKFIADRARNILAIYALGKTGDSRKAAEYLYNEKICGDIENTIRGMDILKEEMFKNRRRRNNCYIHVTYNCNLRCSHCYIRGGEKTDYMDINNIEKLISEAVSLGYRQIIITGGEPLTHGSIDKILKVCGKSKGKGSLLVLRTNLATELTAEDLKNIGIAFDKVIVSVDGSEETHNKRRGSESYYITVKNIKEYQKVNKNIDNRGELSLASVMEASEINGEPGNSVRRLAAANEISNIRFRPILPLGRASEGEHEIHCEVVNEQLSVEDRLIQHLRPIATCGIGQNIFINPDGDSYPCYAWCNSKVFLGNVFNDDRCILNEIIESDKFKALTDSSVDTNEKCRECEYRYLCGGLCKAWGNTEKDDVNEAPKDCTHMKKRSEELVEYARKVLS